MNDKIDPNTNFAKLPSAKWLFFVGFIIQKSKSKHLVCLRFLWWQFFEGPRENILHNFRVYMYSKIIIMRLIQRGTKMIPERPTFDGKSLSLTFLLNELVKTHFHEFSKFQIMYVNFLFFFSVDQGILAGWPSYITQEEFNRYNGFWWCPVKSNTGKIVFFR